jgi:hypothetical protein
MTTLLVVGSFPCRKIPLPPYSCRPFVEGFIRSLSAFALVSLQVYVSSLAVYIEPYKTD